MLRWVSGCAIAVFSSPHYLFPLLTCCAALRDGSICRSGCFSPHTIIASLAAVDRRAGRQTLFLSAVALFFGDAKSRNAAATNQGEIDGCCCFCCCCPVKTPRREKKAVSYQVTDESYEWVFILSLAVFYLFFTLCRVESLIKWCHSHPWSKESRLYGPCSHRTLLDVRTWDSKGREVMGRKKELLVSDEKKKLVPPVWFSWQPSSLAGILECGVRHFVVWRIEEWSN